MSTVDARIQSWEETVDSADGRAQLGSKWLVRRKRQTGASWLGGLGFLLCVVNVPIARLALHPARTCRRATSEHRTRPLTRSVLSFSAAAASRPALKHWTPTIVYFRRASARAVQPAVCARSPPLGAPSPPAPGLSDGGETTLRYRGDPSPRASRPAGSNAQVAAPLPRRCRPPGSSMQ